jgi:hypothetical protein
MNNNSQRRRRKRRNKNLYKKVVNQMQVQIHQNKYRSNPRLKKRFQFNNNLILFDFI